MTTDRRELLGAALLIGAGGAAIAAGPREAHAAGGIAALGVNAAEHGLKSGSSADQTRALQAISDRYAATGTPVLIPPGIYIISGLVLRSGARLAGVAGASIFSAAGDGNIAFAQGGSDISLSGLVFDGKLKPLDPDRGRDGLFSGIGCERLSLRDLTFSNSLLNGISIRECSGRISDCRIHDCASTAIFALDSRGLDISHNDISTIGNNGIQVWRSEAGEDGTRISSNTIAQIAARAGGDGQNGNGINIFRAGGVLASANRIADCAFTAIRGNAASNVQMIGNNCARLGEVALYAEFGFEGALISGNLIDRAATGISVTNFNEGGRLASVQGNLVRNLFRREESVDKRGIGISVEADAAVTGNVIEQAPTFGLLIGWGKYMRDVAATGNLIRNARIGIGISADREAGYIFVANNMISGAVEGGVRALDFDRPTGPDLAKASAEIFSNYAVFANVSI